LSKETREDSKEKAHSSQHKADKAPEKKIAIRKITEGVRGIVRLADTDVDGMKKVKGALLRIKGVGQTLANAIPSAAGVAPNAVIGALPEDQIAKLEDVINDPVKFGIPAHMVNRRKDPATGENIHIHSSNLVFTRKMDIDMMKKIRCYKGIRHELGLPVRGQRTRSSFRTGTTAGVVKKSVLQKAAPAAAPKPGAPAPKPGAAPAAAPKAGAPAAKAAAPAAAKKPEKK